MKIKEFHTLKNKTELKMHITGCNLYKEHYTLLNI